MPVTIDMKLRQLNIIHSYFACVEYTPDYRPFKQWDDDAMNTYTQWEPYWKLRKRAQGLYNPNLQSYILKHMRAIMPDTPRDQSQRLIGSSKSLAAEKVHYARWSNL